jgi:hypothetical protein
MPLEGHWQRQNTPLRALARRELRALVAAAVLIAAIVAIVVATSGGSSGVKAGCLDVTVASTTGGARVHACGAEAKRFCAAQEKTGTAPTRDVRDQCRRFRP